MRRPPSPRQIADALRGRIGWLPAPERDSPLPWVGRRPSVKPILPVHDMDVAVAFYRQLGFDVEPYDAGYAWVRNCGWELFHLSLASDLEAGASDAAAYVHVDDADEWHVAISAAAPDDAAIGPLADQPWGMREFAVTDPSGNVVRFGRNL